MFKPKEWKDQTNLQIRSSLAGTVLKVRMEVGPADREAKEDMSKFVKEMVEENSTPGEETSGEEKHGLVHFCKFPYWIRVVAVSYILSICFVAPN